MKTFKTTRDFAEFTASEFKKRAKKQRPGEFRRWACKQLNIKSSALNMALAKAEFDNPGRNGTRKRVLSLLGYECGDQITVWRKR